MVKFYKKLRNRRRLNTRLKIKGTAERPRLSIFRSNKEIYAQLIDDEKGATLASAKSCATNKEKEDKLTKVSQAKALGKILAEKAKKIGISRVFFDRAGYKYHGRVKALADGAKKAGLIF